MFGWLAGDGFQDEAPTTEATARVGRLLGNVIGIAIFVMMAWVVSHSI